MRVSTRIAKITPRIAMRWLEGNVHNRRLRQSVVNRYARDMAAGKWSLTHQGIAFNEDGTLVDGQHRLWAIVESDVTVSMPVTKGVSLHSQMVIDDHLTRTGSDALSLFTGQQIHAVFVATIRLLVNGFSGQVKMSHIELARGYDRFKPSITWLQSIIGKLMRGVTSAPVITAVARAYYHLPSELLEKFWQGLVSGEAQEGCTAIQNRNIVLLRNFLLLKVPVHHHPNFHKGGVNHRQDIFARTERAIMAFAKNEPISRLVAAKEELFPLPSEGKPRRKTLNQKLYESRLDRAAAKK